MIAKLLKQERPLRLFGGFAAVMAGVSLIPDCPLLVEFLATGFVPRLPTAILASAIMVLAFLFGFSGLILDSVAHGRKEAKRLKYLEFAGLHELTAKR